jgi:hypothetical protein
MKFMNCTRGVLSVGLLVVLSHAASGEVIVQNGGFESPVLDASIWFYTTTGTGTDLLPTVPGWTFTQNSTGPAGILSSSGIGPWGAAAFGSQCAAFSTDATISQIITGFAAGSATFSFYAQASGTGQPLTVTLDAKPLTFSTVASVTPTGTMSLYSTDSTSVAAGAHTLQFKASGWTYLDNVSASNVATPEPSSIALLATCLTGLLAYAWRKRR